ncbi:alanine racemase domain protein [Beutenbergia cavernae DSM 12333]|uniref:Pyridoxal phosphate homeostasis protein n=1 Tax=Beutenbergia cavernae (strain ATCC BAA-8 / DSM 12333 / CCUG 43141 / JCM 11478 / NBRC 16432 / NCIMB 13614 / HKI 0122) TaxID=471853 RepID=C5C2K3_BEUC1|nr:YggS family pyridoxal phosphate-dependent enzyme [Beutenbergia cavernae]ACQ79689.1 alanine racemase domain protein [Beutenbergia cavernae DSM 12333]
MTDVRATLAAARERIADAAGVVGRDPAEIDLLLAVKTQPVAAMRAAISAGGHLLGHNRVQEMAASGPELADLPHEMHLIGHLQSNKVRAALAWATCVQTVDDEALAVRLDRVAGDLGRSLDVFVQVNTSGETTKSGTTPEEAHGLARRIGALPSLRLRGFMTIGANSTDVDVVRASYASLARVRDDVVASGDEGTGLARELSMGMSGDLEIAVAAGATMVRLGTAVFGAR